MKDNLLKNSSHITENVCSISQQFIQSRIKSPKHNLAIIYNFKTSKFLIHSLHNATKKITDKPSHSINDPFGLLVTMDKYYLVVIRTREQECA